MVSFVQSVLPLNKGVQGELIASAPSGQKEGGSDMKIQKKEKRVE